MDDILDVLNPGLSVGDLTPALLAVIALDFAITALHSYQELRGAGGPLWRNFGAIAGVAVPTWLGFPLFTLGLVLGLWALALADMAGWLPIVGAVDPSVSAFALGALIGARISDTLVSHVALHVLGYRPNPGLSSTLLYVIEALFLSVAFASGLAVDPPAAATGFVVGALVFVLVMPLLRLLRALVPTWRRPAWQRWQSIPDWAGA